jgi:hypothetical protein
LSHLWRGLATSTEQLAAIVDGNDTVGPVGAGTGVLPPVRALGEPEPGDEVGLLGTDVVDVVDEWRAAVVVDTELEIGVAAHPAATIKVTSVSRTGARRRPAAPIPTACGWGRAIAGTLPRVGRDKAAAEARPAMRTT